MLTLIKSVDTEGALITVLAARKKPFLLSLVAKSGVTEVAKFVLNRYEDSETAYSAMYIVFESVKTYLPNEKLVENDQNKIHSYMRFIDDEFNECAFSVVVEKMEI